MSAPIDALRFARFPASVRLLLALLCLAACTPSGAKVIRVNRGSTGAAHTGATWASAYLTVAAGLSSAANGDEIWVAKGIYRENVEVPAGVALYGGFAGTETLRTQRNWRTNATVLDGGSDTNSAVALFQSANAGIDGFTVRNGGIGVSLYHGSAAVANCTVYGNLWAIFMDLSSTATIGNCVITSNSYDGVRVDGTASVANSTFSVNDAAISVIRGAATITNCTMSRNCEGVYVEEAAHATVTNCIAAFNEAGIDKSAAGFATLSYNNVYGNEQAQYLNMADPTGTNGNISRDPKLSNSFQNIHLQPGSPCINAGADAAVTSGATDIDGQARIQGTHVDIGSDESDGTTWPDLAMHVSVSGNDANDGMSWETAKKTIAGALHAIDGVRDVWVSAGVYAGGFEIPDGIGLYGGFAGTETALAQRKWQANVHHTRRRQCTRVQRRDRVGRWNRRGRIHDPEQRPYEVRRGCKAGDGNRRRLHDLRQRFRHRARDRSVGQSGQLHVGGERRCRYHRRRHCRRN